MFTERVTEELSFEVRVSWDSCRFGGERPLCRYRCSSCRVKRLYLDAPELICRKCARLIYPSQTMPRYRRDWRRRRKFAWGLAADRAWGLPGGRSRRTCQWRAFYDGLRQKALELEAAGVGELHRLIKPGAWRPKQRRPSKEPAVGPAVQSATACTRHSPRCDSHATCSRAKRENPFATAQQGKAVRVGRSRPRSVVSFGGRSAAEELRCVHSDAETRRRIVVSRTSVRLVRSG